MNRWLLHLLTWISLLVWLACGVAAVRARSGTDRVRLLLPLTGKDMSRVINLSNHSGHYHPGGIVVKWSFERRPERRTTIRYSYGPRSIAEASVRFGDDNWGLPGLRVFTDPGAPGCGRLYLAHWLVSVVTLPLPALVLLRWVQRAKLLSTGKCGSCGYDLRASPDRCPECGAVQTPAEAADVSTAVVTCSYGSLEAHGGHQRLPSQCPPSGEMK